MLWSAGVKEALINDGQFEDVVMGRNGVAKEFRVPFAIKDRLRTDLTPSEDGYVFAEDVDAAVFAVVDEFGVPTSRGKRTVLSVFFVNTPIPAMVVQLQEGSIIMETNPGQEVRVSADAALDIPEPGDRYQVIKTKDLFDLLHSVLKHRYYLAPDKATGYLENFFIEVLFESVQQPDAEPFLRMLPMKYYTDLGLGLYDFSEFESNVHVSSTPELEEMDEAEEEDDDEDDIYDADDDIFDDEDGALIKEMDSE